jgi:hypothetical protein
MDNQVQYLDKPLNFGFSDPKNVELANDLARYKESVISQYAIAKQQQAAQAATAKQKAEADLQQQFLAIPESDRFFPAIEHDFKAAAKRIDFNHQLSLLNPQDPGFDGQVKLINERMPAKERQDFVDTDLYKNAVHENTSNKERVTMADALHDQLLRMKAALDAGDKTLAANIGKTGVMKTINSLQGKDAVSASEQSTRYQDLLSLPDIVIQNSQGQSILQQLASRMAIAYGKDKKEFNNLSDQFNGLVKGSIEADPENFYKTAYELHNAAATTAERNVDRVISMTSPYHAKRMQANKPQRLPAEAVITPQATGPSPYAQTAPLGIPVSTGASGAVSTGTAQTSAPTQQAPSGLNLQQIIEERKRRGLIK